MMRPPDLRSSLTVFLSSSDEVKALRNRVDRIIHEVINPQLASLPGDAAPELTLVRWEQSEAKKPSGGSVNAEFVRSAVASHVTFVLLQTQIRKGTREELEAVIDLPDVQLSVLRFAPDNPVS